MQRDRNTGDMKKVKDAFQDHERQGLNKNSSSVKEKINFTFENPDLYRQVKLQTSFQNAEGKNIQK
jgi:hypothetical protein